MGIHSLEQGAIKNALKLKCSNYFFVVYGDVLFNLDLKNFTLFQKKTKKLIL